MKKSGLEIVERNGKEEYLHENRSVNGIFHPNTCFSYQSSDNDFCVTFAYSRCVKMKAESIRSGNCAYKMVIVQPLFNGNIVAMREQLLIPDEDTRFLMWNVSIIIELAALMLVRC